MGPFKTSDYNQILGRYQKEWFAKFGEKQIKTCQLMSIKEQK